jgi:hypothetical protein
VRETSRALLSGLRSIIFQLLMLILQLLFLVFLFRLQKSISTAVTRVLLLKIHVELDPTISEVFYSFRSGHVSLSFRSSPS